jgi:hypothetical protein
MFQPICYTMQRCLIGSLLVMKRGICNMTWKQNTGACRREQRIHLSQKNIHISLAVQDHACVFLWSQQDTYIHTCVCSSLWIHCTRTNGESTVLFWKYWEHYGNLFGGKDTNSGLTHGFPTITIACELLIMSLQVPGYEIQYKMDHPPYSCDQDSCNCWLFPKVTKDLLTFLTCNTKWRCWQVFCKTIFKIVFSIGTIVSQRA